MSGNTDTLRAETEDMKIRLKNMAQDAVETLKDQKNKLMTESDGVAEGESEEGAITKKIEKVTSKIPSVTFLSVAIGSIAVSALLQLSGRKEDAQFVGQWVPTVLILGLYNKLVKLEGSE